MTTTPACPAALGALAGARGEAVEPLEEAVEARGAPLAKRARVVEARMPVSMRGVAPVEARAAPAKGEPGDPLAQRVRAAKPAAREQVEQPEPLERPEKTAARATLRPMV